MDSKDYTREKTKQSKTNFYYSFLFLPKPKRDAIFTVYSFCRHSDDLVDDAPTPDEARRNLEGWRKEIDACYDGIPNHPIMTAMLDVLEKFPIPKQYLLDLVEGMEMDILKKRYETFDELSRYCYHAASVVGLICIEIFGYRSPTTKDYAINLGKALQLTNILRDVGDDAQKGRIYIPSEDYERFQLTEADFLEQRYSPSFVELMKMEADRARDLFQTATQLYSRNDHPLLFPAEIMRKIYYRIYEKLVENEFDVFHERIRVSNKRKMFYALQEWLSAQMIGMRQWAIPS